MTRERFEDLAEIYGGDIARWPLAERDAAALLMAADPDFAKAALAAPAGLDDLLGAWAPQPVSHQLREAVIASAPRPRADRRARMVLACRVGRGPGRRLRGGPGGRVRLSDTVVSRTTPSAPLSGYDDLSDVVIGRAPDEPSNADRSLRLAGLNLFLIGGVVGGLVVGQRLRSDRPPPMARMNQPVWAAAEA